MNHRYRQKPVVIEAFQMTKYRRWNNNDWPEWLNYAWQKKADEPGALLIAKGNYPDGLLAIKTMEGELLVYWDDWIIQGVQGELYPCKPNIFEQTYEEELA